MVCPPTTPSDHSHLPIHPSPLPFFIKLLICLYIHLGIEAGSHVSQVAIPFTM